MNTATPIIDLIMAGQSDAAGEHSAVADPPPAAVGAPTDDAARVDADAVLRRSVRSAVAASVRRTVAGTQCVLVPPVSWAALARALAAADAAADAEAGWEADLVRDLTAAALARIDRMRATADLPSANENIVDRP